MRTDTVRRFHPADHADELVFRDPMMTNLAKFLLHTEPLIFFVPTDNESEAHYLCAILNAPSVSDLVINYAENTQIGTHIFDYVRIPKFDPEKEVHLFLSQISKAAHNQTIAVEEAMQRIDQLVAKI